MSIVNLKLIFGKKQKQTRERPTQGRGATFIYNRNGRFHTREGLFEWDGLSVAWLYPSILTDSLKMDYPFQIPCMCTAAPSPQKKSEKGCLWGGGDFTQASLRRIIHFWL